MKAIYQASLKKLIPMAALAMGILLFCLALLGCASEFKQSNYLFIQNYGSINAVSLKRGSITLYVEDKVFDTKKQTEQAYGIIKDDYDLLKAAFGLKTKIKVYVLAKEHVLGSRGGIYMNGALYCTYDALINGDYLPFLSGAYLKTSQPWKQLGAYGYVFGREDDQASALRSYYQNEQNLLALSLFAAYFNESFADYQEIEYAESTAVALSRFIIDNYGKNEFLSAGLTDFRQEWLDSLGVNATFAVDYDLCWLEDAEYSEKWLSYPLVISTENRAYNLSPISTEYGYHEFGLDTPALVLRHLCTYKEQMDAIMNYIRQNAPQSYKAILKRGNKIEYYISEREIMTGSVIEDNTVYLKEIGELIHETMHVITSVKDHYAGAWLSEGIAEYFSRFIVRSETEFDKRLYLTLDSSLADDVLLDFRQKCNQYYTEKGGKATSYEVFDRALYEEAVAYATFTHPEYKNTLSGFSFGTASVADRTNRPISGYEGNDLTYPEAYLFTKYLINEYGLDTVLSVLLSDSYSFEKAFGKTYGNAMNEFKLSLL